MAETKNKIVEQYETNFGLTEAEKARVLAFKSAIGTGLEKSPDILGSKSVDDIMHVNSADPLDPAFINVLNTYVFNEESKLCRKRNSL